MLNAMLKSVIDQDRAAVVICDLSHTITYMNAAAITRYESYGGVSLIGASLLACHNPRSCEMINKVVEWFSKSRNNNMIHTFYNAKENKDVYMVALRSEQGELIGYYEKHEYRNRETAPLYDFTQSLK